MSFSNFRRPKNFTTPPTSFVTQRVYWVQARCAMGWNETRCESHCYNQEPGRAQHHGIARIQLEEQRFTEPTESERNGNSDHAANPGHPGDLAQHHALYLQTISAKRHADADFLC